MERIAIREICLIETENIFRKNKLIGKRVDETG